MPGRGLCDRLGADAFLDPHFGGRGMAHQQAATAGVGHYSRGLSGGNGANPTGSIPVHDRSRTSGAAEGDLAFGNITKRILSSHRFAIFATFFPKPLVF
jgi:hypothetical protein